METSVAHDPCTRFRLTLPLVWKIVVRSPLRWILVSPEEKCTKSVNDEIARKGRETMELISAKLSSVFLCATLLNSGIMSS